MIHQSTNGFTICITTVYMFIKQSNIICLINIYFLLFNQQPCILLMFVYKFFSGI